MSVDNQVKHLQAKVISLQRRIDELTQPTEEETEEERDEQERANKDQRKRDRAEKEKNQADQTVAHVRQQAIRALAKLLPRASRQAAQGKPALLRLILRATR